jgi:hypothetical protein
VPAALQGDQMLVYRGSAQADSAYQLVQGRS